MPFWQSSTPNSGDTDAVPPRHQQDRAEQMSSAQTALTHARRNLLGAGFLLLAAFLLVPWVLDQKARAWGDDVILNMPKAGAPVQKNQGVSATTDAPPPAPIDSTSPLKPSQPAPAEASIEPSASAAAKVTP